MVDYTGIVRDLLTRNDIKGAVIRVRSWLESDADDLGVWLAVMDALDHEQLRKPGPRQVFMAGMTEVAEWIGEVGLAWDVTTVLGQVLENDDPQSATTLWVHFVRSFPAHEEGLFRLVEQVLDNGDYRAAAWALDDRVREQPALAGRFHLALGVLALGEGFEDTARRHFKQSGQNFATICEVLARFPYHFPEDSRPDWLLSAGN